MDSHAQIRPAGIEEVKPLLCLAMGSDVQGVGLDAILQNCAFFILDDEKAQFAFALVAQGRELWIQAAGGKGEQDLTALGLDAIEQRAAVGRFASVGFQTRRVGLVKKALKHGYIIDGYILRKAI